MTGDEKQKRQVSFSLNLSMCSIFSDLFDIPFRLVCITALHALKLDRVRRWDLEQAKEIATEEHGWLKYVDCEYHLQ